MELRNRALGLPRTQGVQSQVATWKGGWHPLFRNHQEVASCDREGAEDLETLDGHPACLDMAYLAAGNSTILLFYII